MRDGILLAGCAGLASGILCRSLVSFPPAFLALPLLLASMLLLAWVRIPRASYLMPAAALLYFALGGVRVQLAPVILPEPFVPLLEQEAALEGTVVAEPDIRESSQRVTLEVSYEGEETRVLAVAPLYPEVSLGERVLAEGTLVLPEAFETDGGRTFRYDHFLAKDGVFALMGRASLEPLTPPEGFLARMRAALIEGKRAFQEGLAVALPEPGASLASGLITGGKQGLGDALLDAFVVAGLVHIVVLSGYNVMIVAEAILRCLAFLPRRIAALVAGAVVLLFVLAAGAGAASVRAGVMAGIALLARATGRTYAALRALILAGVLMLLSNPLLLAHDPGFQLSFVATLGLILLAPIIEARLAFLGSAFWRGLVASTLAAQVFVLPLLLYQTGLLSLVALPANLLVLPFVPLAMALSFLAGVVGMLLPALAPVAGLPAHLALSGIIETARAMSALPLSSVVLPAFPFWLVLIAYAGLGLAIAKAPRGSKGPRDARA